MDKFTARRRPTWQAATPAWPFIILAALLVGGACLYASMKISGVLLGDGTDTGRAMLWVKTISNVMVPAVLCGAIAGFALHQLYFAPAGKHGALLWTGVLIAVGAVAGTPYSAQRSMAADRAGYEVRLSQGAMTARAASRRSEEDLYRRLYLLLRSKPFGARNLTSEGGLDTAATAIATHRELIASARKDYDRGQAEARAAMEKAVVDRYDREAVLMRLDEAARPRRALMETMWSAHERIASLQEQELEALRANRSAWTGSNQGAVINNRALFNRVQYLEDQIAAAADEADAAQADIHALDNATDTGIDRVLRAAR